MQKHEVNPLKSLLPIFAQVPIFASMFFGLRGMCNVPVPSMTQGGLAWFPDLTVADPLYILPVFTCASLWLHLYTSSMNSEQTGFVVRGVVLASPIIILPMTITFPSVLFFSNSVQVIHHSFIHRPSLFIGLRPMSFPSFNLGLSKTSLSGRGWEYQK